MKKLKTLGVVIFAIFMMQDANARQSQDIIDIDIFLDDRITQSTSISLTSININTSTGRGDRLMTITFTNTTNEDQEDLYLYFSVESSELNEPLAEFDQEQFRPFSMTPGQVARGNNNQFESGFPGLGEISLEGDISDDALDIVSAGELPAGIYSVVFKIYQGGNRLAGNSVLVGSGNAQFEISPTAGERDIVLNSPGGAIGNREQVQTTLPFFSWEGGGTTRYRVIVVDGTDGGDPVDLIDQAASTEPGAGPDFKMFDRQYTNVTQFNYPSAGVQPLVRGGLYFWRVIALAQTPSGIVERESEIFEFFIPELGGQDSDEESTIAELVELLESLSLESDEINRLLTQNYNLSSVRIGNNTISGPTAIAELERLRDLIESGEIEILD